MDEVQRWIERLEAGADSYACNGYLARLDPLNRTEIYTSLLHERLKRKCEDTLRTYTSTGEDWEQTFFVMLMKFMGAPANGKAFEMLAHRIPYRLLSWCLGSGRSLEALLIGGSGLLDAYRDDQYTLDLKREFEYLTHKYDIKKMSPSMWKISNIYPHNHPVIRMSQVAAILSQKNFLIGNLTECRTPKDVEQLLCVEASEYWVDHFAPSVQSSSRVKRLGAEKSAILAINVVVPLQYAYGNFKSGGSASKLCDRALDLLESVAAENNFKVRRWTSAGLEIKSAFESQALIQLGDEYCDKARCTRCPIGRRIIKSVERSCKLKENA